MGLIFGIIVGLFIGWLFAAITEVDEGIFSRMGFGALGSIMGLLISSLIIDSAMVVEVTWPSLIASLVGAVAFLSLMTKSRGYDLKPRDS